MLKVILPIAAVLLLASLGFFAFKGGPSDLTGNIVLEDASFQLDLEIKDKTFEVEDLNISIINGVVKGEVNGANLRTESPVWVNGFTGKIIITEENTILEGHTIQYSALRIVLRDEEGINVGLVVESGTLEINDFEFAEFDSAVTGTLHLSDNIKVKLEETEIRIEEYTGFFRQHVAPLKTATFIGKASLLEVKAQNFVQNLQG